MVLHSTLPVLVCCFFIVLFNPSDASSSCPEVVAATNLFIDEEFTQNYNETCSKDSDCSSSSMSCRWGRCKCRVYHMYDNRTESCRSFNDKLANCSEDWHCQDYDVNRRCHIKKFDNSERGRCQCKDNFQESFVSDDSYNMCVVTNSKGYRSGCRFNVECLKSLECNNCTCTCPLGHQWSDNSCKRFHQVTCLGDEECRDVDFNRRCLDYDNATKKCQCDFDYVEDFNGRCLEKKKLGQLCTKPIQCNYMKNSICNTRKNACTCLPTHAPVGNDTCQPKQCNATAPCLDVDDNLLQCVDGECRCQFSGPDQYGRCYQTHIYSSSAWAFNFFWMLLLIPVIVIGVYIRYKCNQRYIKRSVRHLIVVELPEESPRLATHRTFSTPGYQQVNLFAVPPPRPPPPVFTTTVQQSPQSTISDVNQMYPILANSFPNYSPPPSYSAATSTNNGQAAGCGQHNVDNQPAPVHAYSKQMPPSC